MAWRTTIGAVIGVVIAFLLLLVADVASQRLYPPAADIDWSDAIQVNRYTGSLPASALRLTLAGWVGATFLGATLGWLIARPRAILISVVMGGSRTAAAIANFLTTRYPSWFVIATMTGIVAATSIAAKLVLRRIIPAYTT